MNKKDYYNNKALGYAEHYGILTYRVKGNLMIYNQNYNNTEFVGNKCVKNPCTYQRTINLDTGEETSKKLHRLQKDGWNNV